MSICRKLDMERAVLGKSFRLPIGVEQFNPNYTRDNYGHGVVNTNHFSINSGKLCLFHYGRREPACRLLYRGADGKLLYMNVDDVEQSLGEMVEVGRTGSVR